MVLFKCGTCTFVMDSDVHGNRPCQMCGERIIKRLPLDRWDVVDAEEYNSLFPPVADFRAAIGRPATPHVRDEVIAKRLQHSPRHRIYVDLLPSSQAIAQGTPPIEDTYVPAAPKKPQFQLGTIGGEMLSCTCATCIYLAERRQKLKREADALEQELEADISRLECKMKKKRAADSKAEETKLAADDDENKHAALAEEK
jgi:hypothetical protein